MQATIQKQINRRRSERRKPRRTVKIECRKGSLGLGANLSSELLDVSDTGARLIIVDELARLDEVELIINGYGMNRPIKRMASVRWIVKMEDGRFCIGAEFQKRLEYRDWQNLASPN
ncbi:MAG: PilZ domain-containing protein [Planctomycetes bacterium]|nr:PilZ domain-containing protein [Planctomycetota bacterium]